MITGLNKSKTLTKLISCECKCNGRKCNSNQLRNNDKCWCEYKKHNKCKKDYIWNLATCNCKNGKYLAYILDDLVITCNEIIESHNEETKTVLTNFSEKSNL